MKKLLLLWCLVGTTLGKIIGPSRQRSRRGLTTSPKRKNDMLYYFYSGKLSKVLAGPEPTLAGWATWSAWSTCTKRCNKGRESRFRTCRTNVADSFAKYVADEISFEQYLKLTPQCNGAAFEHRSCNEHTCGSEWTTWSSWTECSKTCGWNGIQERKRDCFTEHAATTFNFLTSNMPLDAYLKQYSKVNLIFQFF